jgi:hypothetical protein
MASEFSQNQPKHSNSGCVCVNMCCKYMCISCGAYVLDFICMYTLTHANLAGLMAQICTSIREYIYTHSTEGPVFIIAAAMARELFQSIAKEKHVSMHGAMEELETKHMHLNLSKEMHKPSPPVRYVCVCLLSCMYACARNICLYI